MAFSWNRLHIEDGGEGGPELEILASPCVAPELPWRLLVGNDPGSLARAGEAALTERPGIVIAPPEPLAVAAHELSRPGLTGERTLFLPRLDRAVVPELGVAGSLLYLLPLFVQLASEGAPLAVVATALEDPQSADELTGQRGLFSRFEIRRVASSLPVDTGEPAPPIPTEGALETLARAVALSHAGKLEEAKAVLEETVRAHPELPAAHYELGKLRLRTEDLEGAVASFRRTAALLPELSSAWGNLGAALGETGRHQEAIDVLCRAVELDPLSAPFHSSLGAAYRDSGKLEDAEAELRKVQELAPEFVFGHYNLAGILFLQERYDEALEAFSKARALDRSRSPRQSLLVAATHLGAGDTEAAFREYREVFGRKDVPPRSELLKMAEWDLKGLAGRAGGSAALKEAARLVRRLAQDEAET